MTHVSNFQFCGTGTILEALLNHSRKRKKTSAQGRATRLQVRISVNPNPTL